MNQRYLREMVLFVLMLGVGFVPLEGGQLPAGQSYPTMKIDLEQAIELAIAHNHALKAARTQIQQSRAQEITAAIRPNPVLDYDDLFVPLTPSQFTNSNLNQITEFDLGLSWTWERGHKRLARVRAARDQTAVTRSQVSDSERTLKFNVAHGRHSFRNGRVPMWRFGHNLLTKQSLVSTYAAGFLVRVAPPAIVLRHVIL